MFQKLLSKLEDSKSPLLGPIVKGLTIWGLILPERKLTRYLYVIFNTTLFTFMVTEVIEMWHHKSSMKMTMYHMQYVITESVNCLKAFTMLIWQIRWKSVIEYVTRADVSSRAKSDEYGRKIINAYTKYSRKIIYGYWFLLFATCILLITKPLGKLLLSRTYRENVNNGSVDYDKLLNNWLPFNSESGIGYWIEFIHQTIVVVYAGGLTSFYDTLVLVTMVFFRGELELLRRCCSQIFDSDEDEECLRRLMECKMRHADLVKHAEVFNSVLSPIMFYYTSVTSIMLCSSLYQITMADNFSETMLMAEYAVFGVAQLFCYCWHANDVLFMSHEPMRGVYESGWWKRNVYRKEMMLLTGQLDKRVTFTAGPFFSLSLAAFITILKGAYSYHTLLSKTIK